MKVAVVYWSGTGNTEAMAKAVAKGAASKGATVSEYAAADFSKDLAREFDSIAFGCPAMGAEVLEESEFQPMFDEVRPALAGKCIALFGSYGWGDGEWMRTWQSDCEAAGLNLIADGVIANEAPDDAALANCEELGRKLA